VNPKELGLSIITFLNTIQIFNQVLSRGLKKRLITNACPGLATLIQAIIMLLNHHSDLEWN